MNQIKLNASMQLFCLKLMRYGLLPSKSTEIRSFAIKAHTFDGKRPYLFLQSPAIVVKLQPVNKNICQYLLHLSAYQMTRVTTKLVFFFWNGKWKIQKAVFPEIGLGWDTAFCHQTAEWLLITSLCQCNRYSRHPTVHISIISIMHISRNR